MSEMAPPASRPNSETINPTIAAPLPRPGQPHSNEDKATAPANWRLDTPGANEGNLGLVLDVELNVLLRFGQRQLTLREVLDLKCGSVIELDREVDEPVELLLDGRVIARGEAAIVDGNYGLRVTEVVRPASPFRPSPSTKEE